MPAAEQKTNKKSSSPIANRRVGLVDKESGEVIEDGSLIYVPPKVRIKGFFMGMQLGFESMAKAKLKSEALKVMLLMLGRMDYENEVRLTQKQISEILSMKKQNVSRAMRALREAGVIDAQDENRIVRFFPDFVWRGKVQKLNATKKEIAKRKHEEEVAEHHRKADESVNQLLQRAKASPSQREDAGL
jgi:DNA-binding transcriptional ArsR family regulator